VPRQQRVRRQARQHPDPQGQPGTPHGAGGAAWAAARTSTYLGARFRRLHRRFGKQGCGKAAVAVAHDLIVIAWHILRDGVEFYDLGPDYFTRASSLAHSRRKDHLLRELQALGYTVQITPAA